jgi:hypothetical protein
MSTNYYPDVKQEYHDRSRSIPNPSFAVESKCSHEYTKNHQHPSKPDMGNSLPISHTMYAVMIMLPKAEANLKQEEKYKEVAKALVN